MKFIVEPATQPLSGTLTIPGDKSIGHRALLFSLLSVTPVRVRGLGDGADNGRSAKAIAALGGSISRDGDALVIRGAGLDGMRAPAAAIDCGNSGTTIRLLCGLLAGQRFQTTLFGDESLSKRPMRRVIEPLAQMGATIVGPGGAGPDAGDVTPPLTIGPAARARTALD
jgi:3-phosphoshikimate 1-carboxyvinyltransferase